MKYLTAILAIVSAVLYGLLGRSEAKRSEEKAEVAKSSQKASEEATEALIRGMTDEAKPADRGHFDK